VIPPEPPIGCEVIDKHGVRWEHVEGTYGRDYWMRSDSVPDGEPESWVRVNEFGPLRLVWITADLRTGEIKEDLQDIGPLCTCPPVQPHGSNPVPPTTNPDCWVHGATL